jgi:hypothetical protein
MAYRAEKGELFWGYSVGPTGRIIVTLLDAPRYIGQDALVEIVLDTGESIYCTPDHLFMRRDGRWVQAAHLRPGDSLMPLYRKVARGYEMVYQPLNGHFFPTHRLADEWNVRHGIYEDIPATHRHHLDHNRRNNNPWNITRMDASGHIRYHNRESYGEGFDPREHSAAIREAAGLGSPGASVSSCSGASVRSAATRPRARGARRTRAPPRLAGALGASASGGSAAWASGRRGTAAPPGGARARRAMRSPPRGFGQHWMKPGPSAAQHGS